MISFQAELRANKGKKIDDPFTRRSTKPCMVFIASKEEETTVNSSVNQSQVGFFVFLCKSVASGVNQLHDGPIGYSCMAMACP